jgi:hypothetical protein
MTIGNMREKWRAFVIGEGSMAKLENLTGAAAPPKPHGSASSGGAVSDASESLSLSGFPRSRAGPPMTLGNRRTNGGRAQRGFNCSDPMRSVAKE